VNPLSFQFMQLALVSALLVGLAAPAVGVFLVQRRLALMGDGLGHVALTGVALGFLLGTAPVLTAVVVATIGAVVIELVRQQGRTSGDVALALMFYGGIAGGVLLISLSPEGTNANLLSYLFGSLTAVSPGDAVVIAVLAGGLLLALAVVGRQLFAVCHDEEHARVMGLPVRSLNLLLAVMAALTVTVGMRVVGLLLHSAAARARVLRDGGGLAGGRGARRRRWRPGLLLRRHAARGAHRRARDGGVRAG
jgi:zinc transport system permease protein